MPWLLLGCSVLLEVVGTTMLKMADGINNIYFLLLSLLSYGISFLFMTFVFKAIPMSIAYSIWAGSGAVLITTTGAIIFKESLGITKVVFISITIIGIVGLKLYEH